MESLAGVSDSGDTRQVEGRRRATTRVGRAWSLSPRRKRCREPERTERGRTDSEWRFFDFTMSGDGWVTPGTNTGSPGSDANTSKITMWLWSPEK